MNKLIYILVAILGLVIGVTFYFSKSEGSHHYVNASIEERFEHLSKNGNSSCSVAFQDSIAQMSNDERIQGSCCTAMSMHRYREQVEGLKQYQSISEIPPDSYDIDAALAKRMMGYYDFELSPEGQAAYDYAMEHSEEHGPCCCKCWRWYVYGGLGKYLIKEKGFTGEQLTELWDLSDGCGGDENHAGHHG